MISKSRIPGAATDANPPSAPHGAAVAIPEGELLRRVTLRDEDRARVTWRPLKPVQSAESEPFDLEACIEKLNFRGTGWHDQERLGRIIPAQPSKEEAWFWLNVLNTPYHPVDVMYEWQERLRRERAATAVPSEADVRAWVRQASRPFPGHIFFEAPQTLRPFFSPREIAGLIVEAGEAHAARWHSSYKYDDERILGFVFGFHAFVAPHVSESERNELRDAIERMYDAEPDRTAIRAALLLALLAAAGGGSHLAAHVASRPDKAWISGGAHWWQTYWFERPAGFLNLLAGLPDEASFVREARRLVCVLRPLADLRLWLAATEWRELDFARDAVLAAQNKDEAAAMMRILALVEAPETAITMLELKLRPRVPALASEWLAAHPLHAAVGLVPVAMEQGKLADAARDHLHAMRRSGLAPVLRAAAAHLTAAEGGWLLREILDAVEETLAEIALAELPEALHAVFASMQASKPPGWLTATALPAIKVNGKRLAAGEVITVLAALKAKPDATTAAHVSAAPNAERATFVSALKEHADPSSLDAFAWKLFDLWLGEGAPSKDKWAMGAIGLLGGDGCVLKLTPLVREWPGTGGHARAALGLECLREVGSDTALMALNGIAQKLKFKSLKQKAQEMVAGIAQSRGLMPDQLADRVVPDCGLDARGSRVFDFGPRQFRFVLGPEMKPLVQDCSGKVLADVPAPNNADDQVMAEAAIAEWKLLKKTLREVLKIQAERLQDAMVTGRRWSPGEFDTLLVKHPLMVNLVRQLVLAAYDEAGKVTQTFRVTEDQTLADHNDEETALPPDCYVGVVHPVLLDGALKSAWEQVLSDYAIIPPFAQLGRKAYRPDPADLEDVGITRFRGPKIPGMVMYGMLERSHWLRDPAPDGGRFNEHAKYFPSADLTAFIRYTGMSEGYYKEKQELEAVYFVPGPGRVRWEKRKRLHIKDVDPVVLSEVLRLANAIVSKAE